jgi:hypothetical protein
MDTIGTNIPFATSITAIIVAIVSMAGSYLAYHLGKKRLNLDSKVYENGKDTRDADIVTLFSGAAKASAETLENSMRMNKSLQDEIVALKLEIIDTNRSFTEQAARLANRVNAVEIKLLQATEEIAILIAERLEWMNSANKLHKQLISENIDPVCNLPFLTERRINKRGTVK